MEIRVGRQLAQFIEKKHKDYRKRFCYDILEDYLENGTEDKVCCLFGLRRTGKTTMMFQAMYDRRDAIEDMIFIQCEYGDTIAKVKDTLNEYPHKKYIFIDEATKARGFVNASSVLADIYKGADNRIVLSGTDSLCLKLTEADELFDRCTMIHTTYISYEEYRYLLDKGIMDYLRYGGTLTDGKVFYNNDSLEQYTNTAIIDNIQHTAEQRKISQLERIIENDLLKTVVNSLLQQLNRDFVHYVISENIKSGDIGSLCQLLSGRRDRGDESVPDNIEELESENVMAAVMHYLGIRRINMPIDDKEKEYLKLLLEKMDVIKPDNHDGFYFVQVGMRHCQIEQIIEGISVDEVFAAYSSEQQKLIVDTLKEDIEGRMLEELVTVDLIKNPEVSSRCNVYKFSNAVAEYDVVVQDKNANKAVVFEVKRSSERVSNQTKHLRNEELKNDLHNKKKAEIVSKVVLYNGKSVKDASDQGIIYINLSDFLSNPAEMVEKLFDNELEVKCINSTSSKKKDIR